MTAKEKKSRKKYFIILAIYTIALMVLGIIALNVVWQYAEEYESSQIDNVIDEYMDTINRDKWSSLMDSSVRNLVNDFQTYDDVEKVVKDFLNSGDIRYTTGGIGDVMKYNLSCDGKNIGQVSFKEDKTASSKFKMYPWHVVDEVFNFDFLKNEQPISIEIPQDFTLKVNGVEVGEQYITEKDIPFDVLKMYYASYKDLPTKVRYEINGLVGDVSTQVFDADGNEFTIDSAVNDMQFVKPCTGEEEAELKAFMENGFTEAFVKFWGTRNVDATYPTLMQYVKKGSALQQDMYTYTLDAATWVHTNSVVVTDMKFNYAFSLGGGFYVVSESIDTIAYADYKTVEESSDVTVIVMKDQDTGEILAIDRA